MENLKLTLKDLELIDYALECQIADNKESVQNRIWKIQDRITKIQNENTKRKTQQSLLVIFNQFFKIPS